MVSKNTRIAYIIIILGFFLRLAYVQFISPISHFIFSDMANYVKVAEAIQNGDWRVTHFFQPIGFPYVILALKNFTSDWVTSLEWIHITTGTLSLWFIWSTTRESFGEKIALITLGLASVHLPWLSFVGLALSENLFILFLSILAWLTLKVVREQKKIYACLWALTFFMAFILKGTHIFFGPLFVLTLFYFYRNKVIKNILIISLIMSAGLLGHGLFTKQKIGKFQMSASAGGLNFVEGKCPLKNNADNAGYSWLSPLYHQLRLNKLKRWDHPFTDSAFFMQEGFKCIKRNPAVMIQSLEGIPFLFFGNTLWPANQSKVANKMRLYELYFSCFCIIGLIVFLRFINNSPHKREDILVWLLPIFSVMVCVYIFKSEIRFRIPFDVWIIPVAIKGWSLLFKAKIIEPQQL
jgi:hypothetical protein